LKRRRSGPETSIRPFSRFGETPGRAAEPNAVADDRLKQPNRDPTPDELRARQSNIVWPAAVKNTRGVDALLFKGSSTATIVQQIGTGLFGTAFLVVGVVLFLQGRELHPRLMGFFALGGQLRWRVDTSERRTPTRREIRVPEIVLLRVL
jgi:hypothetical protein